jgi:hypothetical protein
MPTRQQRTAFPARCAARAVVATQRYAPLPVCLSLGGGFDVCLQYVISASMPNVPPSLAFSLAWATVSHGLPCRMGYRVAWATVSHGLPCRMGYPTVPYLTLAISQDSGRVLLARTLVEY